MNIKYNPQSTIDNSESFEHYFLSQPSIKMKYKQEDKIEFVVLLYYLDNL